MSAVPVPLTPELIGRARQLAAVGDIGLMSALQGLVGATAPHFIALLSESFAYPAMDLATLQDCVPDFTVASYTDGIARGVVFARDAAGMLQLLLSDPFDQAAEDWALRRLGTAWPPPGTALVHPDDFQAWMAQQELKLRAMDGVDAGGGVGNDEEVAAVITLATIGGDASPVVRLVNSTIYDALKLKASDIHLECDAGCLHVMYRIDGVLVPITQVAGQDMAEQVISRVKVMAELDIAERRVPQDGRF
jgi:general secretion pathway protein E